MIVRVNWFLGAHSTSKDLDSSVRNDFIGVHVGLGARSSLPNNKGEVVEMLEVSYLSGKKPVTEAGMTMTALPPDVVASQTGAMDFPSTVCL